MLNFQHLSRGKKLILLISSLAVLALGLFALFYKTPEEIPNSEFKTYASELGISFQYPITYFLETKELGDGKKGHLSIVLTEDTEENRLVREGKSPGRDGPVSITIELFQSPEYLDPQQWVKHDKASNFNLSNGMLTDAIIAGKKAVSYHWSGLYEADSFVLQNRDYVVFASVTYIAPEDQIKKDFNTVVIETLAFQ